VEEWRNMADAVLVDVREADEFKVGHIPGAINVKLLQELKQ
jgi:rhodanese-related sulfurtransferase